MPYMILPISPGRCTTLKASSHSPKPALQYLEDVCAQQRDQPVLPLLDAPIEGRVPLKELPCRLPSPKPPSLSQDLTQATSKAI